MELNKQKRYYRTRESFDRDRETIPSDCIVFIEEGNLIYTHNRFFGGGTSLTQEQIEQLVDEVINQSSYPKYTLIPDPTAIKAYAYTDNDGNIIGYTLGDPDAQEKITTVVEDLSCICKKEYKGEITTISRTDLWANVQYGQVDGSLDVYFRFRTKSTGNWTSYYKYSQNNWETYASSRNVKNLDAIEFCLAEHGATSVQNITTKVASVEVNVIHIAGSNVFDKLQDKIDNIQHTPGTTVELPDQYSLSLSAPDGNCIEYTSSSTQLFTEVYTSITKNGSPTDEQFTSTYVLRQVSDQSGRVTAGPTVYNEGNFRVSIPNSDGDYYLSISIYKDNNVVATDSIVLTVKPTTVITPIQPSDKYTLKATSVSGVSIPYSGNTTSKSVSCAIYKNGQLDELSTYTIQWIMYDTQGQNAGSNTISNIQGSTVLNVTVPAAVGTHVLSITATINDTEFVLKDIQFNVYETGTSGEPGQNGENAWGLSILSSKGAVIRNNDSSTYTLTAYVYNGEDDVTDTIDRRAFSWKRKSSDGNGDLQWDALHKQYGNVLLISTVDVGNMSLFECELDKNYIN